MSFDFTCGFCGTTLEAEEDWIGQEAECPACQNIFIVSKPIASGNGDSVSISHKERIKILAKQHKKMLILAGILILFIILISITSAIIHKYIIPGYYIRNSQPPVALLHIGSYIGTPVQRANSYRLLATRIVYNNKNQHKKDYYIEKGINILKNNKATEMSLRTLIALKVLKGDYDSIGGACSAEGEQLMKINILNTFWYVDAKYKLKRNTQKDLELLKEFKTQAIKKAESGNLYAAFLLGMLYSGIHNITDAEVNYGQAEYYFEKAGDIYWHSRILHYIYHKKFDILEEYAQKIAATNKKSQEMDLLGWTMFRSYLGYPAYVNFREIEGIPKNYKKAVKWNDFRIKHLRNPSEDNIKYGDADKELKKAFPEEYK